MAIRLWQKTFERSSGKENVMTDEADRQSYSFDSAVLPPVTPAMVVFQLPRNNWASLSKAL